MNRLIVEKDAVGLFAVGSEALAVVRGHDHRGVGVNFLLLERGEESSNSGIGRRDRRIVRRGRRVRVVDLNPQKKWVLRILSLSVVSKPRDHPGHHLGCAALGNRQEGIAGSYGTKAGVVGLKAAVKALRRTVPRVKRNRADKGRRAVALCLQQIRQKWK